MCLQSSNGQHAAETLALLFFNFAGFASYSFICLCIYSVHRTTEISVDHLQLYALVITYQWLAT